MSIGFLFPGCSKPQVLAAAQGFDPKDLDYGGPGVADDSTFVTRMAGARVGHTIRDSSSMFHVSAQTANPKPQKRPRCLDCLARQRHDYKRCGCLRLGTCELRVEAGQPRSAT